MKNKYYFSVHAEDYDEAIEKAKEERDTIIPELIKRNQNSFILELTVPVRFHEKIDEYEDRTVCEYEVEINELFDDTIDCIEWFSFWVKELQEELEKCKKDKK